MFIETEKIAPREMIPGYKAKFIHTERMTIAFWEVTAGASMPVHQHMHEQTSQVLEGKFELTVNGVRNIIEPGSVTVIAPHVPHGGVAITDCRLMDVFSPVREDYK